MAESSVMRGTKLRVEVRGKAGQPLSPRQREIVLAAADGLTRDEIAHRLGCSADTIKNHVSTIFTKLEARSMAQAVAIVVRGECDG